MATKFHLVSCRISKLKTCCHNSNFPSPPLFVVTRSPSCRRQVQVENLHPRVENLHPRVETLHPQKAWDAALFGLIHAWRRFVQRGGTSTPEREHQHACAMPPETSRLGAEARPHRHCYPQILRRSPISCRPIRRWRRRGLPAPRQTPGWQPRRRRRPPAPDASSAPASTGRSLNARRRSACCIRWRP